MKILLSIILLFAACDQFTNGYRILGVFPVPGKSHWVMMEQLMKALAERGHQVDVVTHFLQNKPVPNYREISIEGRSPSAVNNMTATQVKLFGTINIKMLMHMAGSEVCKLMETPELQDLINNPPSDPPYDLVITELFAAPCYLAFGRHLNITMIAAMTSVFQDWISGSTGYPHNPAYVPTFISTFGQKMNFWERLQNFLLTNIIAAKYSYYSNFQTEMTNKIFGMELSSIEELYEDISLILVNSHHTLHGVRPTTPSVVEVAGLHLTEDGDPLAPEVQKWLDESKHGCVFVTFGSMVRIETFPKELMETFYKSFEAIAPVRVLMKIAKKEELLPGLPKNVMVQPWFPQMAVLKHKNTKAFITHGGLMGTQESIYAGVPMVGIPLFGDQHINILNYVNKNVAVSLGGPQNVTEEKLTAALKTVLYDPVYRANIKKLSELFNDRPMSARDTAVYWVEYVARHGKALQSPSIHLHWWQRNLLDVYAFLTFCVVTVLYIVFVVLRKIKNWLVGCKTCSKKADKGLAAKKNK